MCHLATLSTSHAHTHVRAHTHTHTHTHTRTHTLPGAGFAHPLAASCDDGSVRVFHVEGGEPGAHYSRTLAHLQGRALAVAWHPAGSALVAGGADGCIHVLDPSSGGCVCVCV